MVGSRIQPVPLRRMRRRRDATGQNRTIWRTQPLVFCGCTRALHVGQGNVGFYCQIR